MQTQLSLLPPLFWADHLFVIKYESPNQDQIIKNRANNKIVSSIWAYYLIRKARNNPKYTTKQPTNNTRTIAIPPILSSF